MENIIKPLSRLAIIIPCYNEEEVLPSSIKTLENILFDLINKSLISSDSFLLFIDDGSRDSTWEIIKKYKRTSGYIKAIRFSRNFGNQSAILAGLNETRKLNADIILTIDADLQQDVNKIEEFIKYYYKGYDIVAGVRNNQKSYNFIKRFFTKAFYQLINFLGVNLKPNHSEFRLINRKTLDIISNYKERNIFFRALFNELGLKTKYINFEVSKRQFGKSKFSLKKLFELALDGIVSYSTYPLRIVFLSGIFISSISFVVAVLILLEQLLKVNLIYDIQIFKVWVSFIMGVQILCIGIIGEYIGQILSEVKQRPRYIILEEI